MNKLLSALSLARKAGRLEIGFDPVQEAVKLKKALLVVIVRDASQRTARETERICRENGTEILLADVTKDDTFRVLGKTVAVIAVCDGGFADMIKGITSTTIGEDK